MSFSLPDLPYAYDALGPYMSRETLEYHHDKHHLTYVNNGNDALKGTDGRAIPSRKSSRAHSARAVGRAYRFAAPFVRRCLSGSTMAPFPHPSIGRAIADASRRREQSSFSAILSNDRP